MRGSQTALVGPHGDRYLSVFTDLPRAREYDAEPRKAPFHEGRVSEENVTQSVRLLTAHDAPVRSARDIGALGCGYCWDSNK